VRKAILLLLASFALSITGAGSILAQDWPMFHHDLQNTGYTTSPSTNNVLWSYPTGDEVFSSLAVAEGYVFVGSWDKKVYCLRASDGSLIWSYPTGDEVFSSPAVAEGYVFVGSDDHNVYCLDASDGSLIWSYGTGWSVDSSPAVADGKVLVGGGDHKVYCFGSEELGGIPTGLVAYPNPFSLSRDSSLTFSGSSVLYAKIQIFTLGGELVRTLEDKYGMNQISWDGKNETGDKVARGTYIYVTEDARGKITIVE